MTPFIQRLFPGGATRPLSTGSPATAPSTAAMAPSSTGASADISVQNPVYRHLFIDPNAFLSQSGYGGLDSGYNIFQNMPQYGGNAMGVGQGILQNMPQRTNAQARPQMYGSIPPEIQRMQQQEQMMQRMNRLMMERGEYEDAQRQAASFTPRPAGPGSLGGVYDRGGFLQPSDYVPPSAEEIMMARKTGMSPTAVRMRKMIA